ncbi:MAG: MFS transporter [Gemmatales bacterium]|nr:MFS transporter [Gemmatales bacterium]MDW7994412.1 MFS transporter [Gemmatales bacterium]
MRWYSQATRGQWLALVAALLGWLFDGFEMGIFPAVARPALLDVLGHRSKLEALNKSDPGYEQVFRIAQQQTGSWYGRITAAFLVGAALGGWLFGWIGDRLGRVRGLMLSVLTYSLFTGLCGLAQDSWQLLGLRFLASLGMGGEWALGVALVMEKWPAHARPMLAGLIGAAANVGFTLAALLAWGFEAAGLPIAQGGWRWVLGFCALPALLTFFIRYFVPESERWQEASQSGPRPNLIEIFRPGIASNTLVGSLLGAIALIGTWGSVQWIPPWVNSQTHAQWQTSLAQICSGLGACLFAFLGGVVGQAVSRRLGYFSMCLASLLLCAILFRWPWHFSSHTANWTFMSVVFATGGITAAFYGWFPLYFPELFPTRVRATGQGFCFNVGRVVAAVGAIFTGTLIQEIFHGDYARAGATTSLIYILGLLIIWFAPETKGRPLPD